MKKPTKMQKVKKMKLELCGYFDNNFGDDYMQKIVVHNMPEIDFFVSGENLISPVLLQENNVYKKNDIDFMQKLLVTGSGFMINSKEARKCEIVWFLKKKHIADYCIGCNIEPFKTKFDEWLIIRKLEKFRLLAFRDKKSLSWFKNNCRKKTAYYMPDILFSIPDCWLFEKNNDKKLGISVIHRKNDSADNSYYRAMAEIADYWIEVKKTNVILMAFDTGIENDTFSCECIKNLMQHKEKAEIAEHRNDCEILKAYSSCEKIIGARFHSAVLALKMNLDFYPVIYRDKMKNLISDIKYPVEGCNISDINTESIKVFINSKNIPFRIDKEYIIEAKNSFMLIKKHIIEGLK